MTARISLALVIHNHQPVGNFGWVFEEVFGQAYEPMIGALERHPHMHVGLHYTGPLLQWMAANEPDAITRLRSLSDRGQIEILGGGLYEPILAALPQRDRHAQLARMRAGLEEMFGTAPAGAWLAERVWEPSVPFDLAEAGYRYTILDDNHLRAASVADEDMWGTYTTDDQGRVLTIFGTEKGLRYRIPFRPVGELIEYLQAAATEDGRRVGMMGDDGEKFGAWPGTYELCWGKGRWIDDCFEAIAENSDWLATVTPSEWLSREPPLGHVYVPTASYVEMTEWALPPDDANTFHELLELATEEESPAVRFLRGAMWRNFQARYREVNDLHKQMLRVSARVDAMAPGALRERALDHLHRGQSNDCYWHGLFGGIYIVHMRMATLAELIAAEDLAAGEVAIAGVGDHDLDGRDEILLGTPGQTVLVDIADGAGIGSWDLRASRVALVSVIRRRPESYHQTLREMDATKERGEQAAGKVGISIGDVMLSKEPGLSHALVYDDHERRSGLVRLTDGSGVELGEFVKGEWRMQSNTDAVVVLSRSAPGFFVRKTISVGGTRMDGWLSVAIEIQNRGLGSFEGTLELEWNLNLMGGGGNPEAFYRWDENEVRFDTQGSLPSGGRLTLGNRYEGVEIAVSLDPPMDQKWSSVDTVSNSEAGFERVHQGSCLIQRWPMRLAPTEQRTFSTTMRFTQSRDRLAEEIYAEEST